MRRRAWPTARSSASWLVACTCSKGSEQVRVGVRAGRAPPGVSGVVARYRSLAGAGPSSAWVRVRAALDRRSRPSRGCPSAPAASAATSAPPVRPDHQGQWGCPRPGSAAAPAGGRRPRRRGSSLATRVPSTRVNPLARSASSSTSSASGASSTGASGRRSSADSSTSTRPPGASVVGDGLGIAPRGRPGGRRRDRPHHGGLQRSVEALAVAAGARPRSPPGPAPRCRTAPRSPPGRRRWCWPSRSGRRRRSVPRRRCRPRAARHRPARRRVRPPAARCPPPRRPGPASAGCGPRCTESWTSTTTCRSATSTSPSFSIRTRRSRSSASSGTSSPSGTSAGPTTPLSEVTTSRTCGSGVDVVLGRATPVGSDQHRDQQHRRPAPRHATVVRTVRVRRAGPAAGCRAWPARRAAARCDGPGAPARSRSVPTRRARPRRRVRRADARPTT